MEARDGWGVVTKRACGLTLDVKVEGDDVVLRQHRELFQVAVGDVTIRVLGSHEAVLCISREPGW